MENLIAYIKNEKAKNEKNINCINEKISNSEYNVEKIDSMIVELTKNIDTTYEIFSPNAYDKDYNVVEIEKLNLKKNELLLEMETLEGEKKVLLESKNRIDIVFDEIIDIENRLANNVKNTQYLLDKEKRNYDSEFKNEVVQLLEYQINKQNHYFENDIKKEIDLIENKITLCENFIDIDVNRAKLEISKLKDVIGNFEKNICTRMFHVKHSLNEVKVSFSDSIKEFINGYKKNIKMKIDYKFVGDEIIDSSKNVINVIRIIKEAIDNAESYSNGSIITITIFVDDLTMNFGEDAIYTKSDNLSKESNSDMHQINFTIDEEKNKYNITVKISDNGDGFSLQDDNVLVGNDLYGIYMMRYRSKLINGTFDVQSELGLGTTVTLVYQTGKD